MRIGWQVLLSLSLPLLSWVQPFSEMAVLDPGPVYLCFLSVHLRFYGVDFKKLIEKKSGDTFWCKKKNLKFLDLVSAFL